MSKITKVDYNTTLYLEDKVDEIVDSPFGIILISTNGFSQLRDLTNLIVQELDQNLILSTNLICYQQNKLLLILDNIYQGDLEIVVTIIKNLINTTLNRRKALEVSIKSKINIGGTIAWSNDTVTSLIKRAEKSSLAVN